MIVHKVAALMTAIFLTISVSACQLAVPFIQGFQDTGLTEVGRVELFSKRLTEFNHALSDGNRTRIMAFAADDYKPAFKQEMLKMARNEKIVNAEVDLVDFKENSRKVEVEAIVKYFRQTDYIVKDRLVLHTWAFETGSGWYLTNYQVLTDDYR